MTLQERLREQGQITKTVVLGAPADSRVLSERFIPDPLCHEAADALDAKDARIKELEGALIVSVQAMEWIEAEASARLRFRDNERYPALCNALANIRTVMVSAREALK